jgi:hypothetical protein
MIGEISEDLKEKRMLFEWGMREFTTEYAMVEM